MKENDRQEKPLYLDTSLPFPVRVKELIKLLTLDEKAGLLSHTGTSIPRLDIPGYNYWSEALHGVARNGRATVFPQAIGMAATWDKEMIYQVADAISDEGRAKYHEALRRNGYTDQYQGLNFWSPNVNIFRDPRWGRGQETWGEDPFLTGEMASAFVKGMQGSDPKYLKTAACAKHFAVHSGPERERHTFNAVVTKRELYDTYLPAFRKMVRDANVEAVMGAYNRTLGEVCCASKLLIEDILRGEWKFQGHFVSDCGALSDFHLSHKVTKDAAESAALALQHGCDLGCDHVFDEIPEAIKRGLINEEDIDHALERVLLTRFKLGMFDPPQDVPFASIPESVVGSDKHRELAYQAAVESVVLLKNKGNILPIQSSVRKIFVTGPNATSTEVLLGNYYGFNERMVTMLEGITGRIPEGMGMEYTTGAMLKHPREIKDTWAPGMAQSSDLAIVCGGFSSFLEGEEGESLLSPQNGDRNSISLPTSQINYIKELAISGTKIVLVLTGGSPIALGEIEDMVDAILFIWYPGMEGGRAVADVLFGDVSPSGKLPLTFPKSLDQIPPFDDYSMNRRTYRYMTEEPLYPFGFGLSYSTFEYSDMHLEKEIVTLGDSLHLAFIVRNNGNQRAAEVVQFYLTDLEASTIVPRHRLIGFERIILLAGESKKIEFTITPEIMSFFDDHGELTIEPGDFRLEVGGCSPGKRGQDLGAPKPLSAVFKLE
ncbi:MAG: glycoside hydrolase family 3 protein [Chloroflexi bacterium]|nr:glycoside hydrolase family 3 protein [Chloroflexota bacterium]